MYRVKIPQLPAEEMDKAVQKKEAYLWHCSV